jgi:trigger factor
MNVTETSAEGLKRELKITVPASEVEDKITERLNEVGRSVRIPGFRPGKVPLTLLRKRFGSAVRAEVLEHAVHESSSTAMQERNLRPALTPKIESMTAKEGDDLEYTMSLEVLPEMPEADFGNLGLEKLIAEIPDEEVEKSLERLAEAQRKAVPVERAAQSGDILVADVFGKIGDEEIPGSRGEGRHIELGAEGLLPGFTEQLVGVTAGETRNVTVTFPPEYGNPEMAGKEGVFEIVVKEVQEREPAKIDDALAEQMALENLDELRQEIRQRMQREYDSIARQQLKRALLDKLAERYDFAVPSGMVELEFNQIWAQYEGEREARKQMEAARAGQEAAADGPIDAAAVIAPEESALEGAPERAPSTLEGEKPEEPEEHPHHHGLPGGTEAPLDGAAVVAPEETALEGASDKEADPDAEDDGKARDEFQRIAERRVRLGLLLADVGSKNNIIVSQEELNQALAQEARRHPGYERQVIDYYRQNPDALNNLRAPIFEEKVVDFIVELAKPEERKVTPEELIKADEAETEASETAD